MLKLVYQLLWLNPFRFSKAIIIHYENEFWQMDAKTALLDGNLTEEVYMTQPEGFTSTNSKEVCKALESIYGLK